MVAITGSIPASKASREAADPRLRREAARLAAWTGRFKQAPTSATWSRPTRTLSARSVSSSRPWSRAKTSRLLRAGATVSLILTLKLAERHAHRGEPRMAADVLKAGAERWTDPRMMLMAAHGYREAGDLEAARETAQSALTVGGPRWGAGARTLVIRPASL